LKKDVLAFDVDGVIVDYFPPFLAHVNKVMETNWHVEDCTSHNMAVGLGISTERMRELLASYETEDVIAELPPVDQAIESLTRLKEKYDIAIITGRKMEWENSTKIWFNKHFPHVTIYHATGRHNPFGGLTGMNKPQIAEQIGALCMVEDNEFEFVHWDSNLVEPICFAQPWNRSLRETHPTVLRMGWPEILDRYLS
jgi:hypothetical protein